jgi:hypothetical protein
MEPVERDRLPPRPSLSRLPRRRSEGDTLAAIARASMRQDFVAELPDFKSFVACDQMFDHQPNPRTAALAPNVNSEAATPVAARRSDGPVDSARRAGSLRIAAGLWRQPARTHGEPVGSVRRLLPRRRRSAFSCGKPRCPRSPADYKHFATFEECYLICAATRGRHIATSPATHDQPRRAT